MNYMAAVRKVITGLVSRHPAFVRISPRILLHTPVEHCGKFVVLSNCRPNRYFTVAWRISMFCEPLSEPGIHLGRTAGLIGRSTRFRPKGQNGCFNIDDPTMAEDFVDQVEIEALPVFKSINDFENAARFVIDYPDMEITKPVRWRALMAAACGDIEGAQRLWRSLDVEGRMWRVPNMNEHFGNYHQWCRLAAPLMAGDRVALAKLLHEWEEQEVRGTKLERYWTSTPFPLETMA